jgi:hypothetical protein
LLILLATHTDATSTERYRWRRERICRGDSEGEMLTVCSGENHSEVLNLLDVNAGIVGFRDRAGARVHRPNLSKTSDRPLGHLA